MNTSNKSTFFSIDILVPNHNINSNSFNKIVNDNIDLIFYSMSGDPLQAYKIVKTDGSRIIVIFKAQTRKRTGQLNKFCQRYFADSVDFKSNSMTKDQFLSFLIKLKNNKDFSVKSFNESTSSGYKGNDIKIFDNKNKWHPWQKQVYNMIYNDDHTIKTPDHRSIVLYF